MPGGCSRRATWSARYARARCTPASRSPLAWACRRARSTCGCGTGARRRATRSARATGRAPSTTERLRLLGRPPDAAGRAGDRAVGVLLALVVEGRRYADRARRARAPDLALQIDRDGIVGGAEHEPEQALGADPHPPRGAGREPGELPVPAVAALERGARDRVLDDRLLAGQDAQRDLRVLLRLAVVGPGLDRGFGRRRADECECESGDDELAEHLPVLPRLG